MAMTRDELEAEYEHARANEIEREAVDYFDTDLLDLSGAPNAYELLELFVNARDTHQAVPIMGHKLHTLAEYGAAIIEAQTALAAKLADEYVEREL